NDAVWQRSFQARHAIKRDTCGVDIHELEIAERFEVSEAGVVNMGAKQMQMLKIIEKVYSAQTGAGDRIARQVQVTQSVDMRHHRPQFDKLRVGKSRSFDPFSGL